METFLYLFVHYGLPLLLTLFFVYTKFKSKVGLVTMTVLTTSVCFYMYLSGQYAIVGNHYIRYVLLLGIIFLLYRFSIKNKVITRKKKIGWFMKIRISITGILSLYVLYFCASILFANSNYDHDAVNLEFPLKGGEFYISSGGTNSLMNNHLRNYPSPQQYAVDINKLSRLKTISKGILSKKNSEHYIFSETVYCPCDGIVTDIKNSVADNLLSSMNVSSKDGTGNYVYLKCDSVYVSMLHLKKNSILVTKDQRVTAGLPLGLVGNSGFSQEPHLHIQASKYKSDSTLIGIPIKFGGSILSRNDIYKD